MHCGLSYWGGRILHFAALCCSQNDSGAGIICVSGTGAIEK